MRVLNQAFDAPLKHEENAAGPLAGGIMQHGYQCGMIWGAALAAGAEVYRRYGAGPQAETIAILTAQRLVESFRTRNTHINCLEITEIDKSSTTMQMVTFFLLKGGTIGCFRMAAQYAKIAFNEVSTALTQQPNETPSPPISCAAMLAQKMGASDMHTVMAAGLAGGIGLCGGACGALGAAIWLRGLNKLDEGAKKIAFKDREPMELIDRFLKRANYKFTCAEIVGRRFEDVDDHAAYMRGGGCAEIIDTLSVA